MSKFTQETLLSQYKSEVLMKASVTNVSYDFTQDKGKHSATNDPTIISQINKKKPYNVTCHPNTENNRWSIRINFCMDKSLIEIPGKNPVEKKKNYMLIVSSLLSESFLSPSYFVFQWDNLQCIYILSKPAKKNLRQWVAMLHEIYEEYGAYSEDYTHWAWHSVAYANDWENLDAKWEPKIIHPFTCKKDWSLIPLDNDSLVKYEKNLVSILYDITETQEVMEENVFDNNVIPGTMHDQIRKLSIPDVISTMTDITINEDNQLCIKGIADPHWRYYKKKDIVYYVWLWKKPRGNALWFLYYYFNQKWTRVIAHLNTIFVEKVEIYDVTNHSAAAVPSVTYKDVIIQFKKDCTTLWCIVEAWWKEKTVEMQIFNVWVKFLWRGYVTFDSELWELDHWQQCVYLMSINGEVVPIMVHCSIAKFNAMYSRMWLSFHGWSEALLLKFFDALRYSEWVRDIDVIEMNWHYDWFTILWWELVYWELPSSTYIYSRYEYPIENSKEQISIQDYFKEYKEIRSESITTVSYLQAIVLMWMNFWHWDNACIYPWFMISGDTWSGKSTMSTMLKWSMWYGDWARSFSARDTWQPIDSVAGDQSIMFIEEFTKIFGEKKIQLENKLRDIMNRWKRSRGMSNRNVTFKYRSPIFINGESMPSQQSVVNRLVLVFIELSDKKDGKQQINSLKKKSILSAVCNFFHSHKNLINKKRQQFSSKLQKSWIDDRTSDVWSYMFAVNYYLEIVPENDLANYMNELLDRIWYNKTIEQKSSRDYINQFRAIINIWFSKRFMTGSIHNYGKWIMSLEIFFDDHYLQSNIAKMKSALENVMDPWFFNIDKNCWMLQIHRVDKEHGPINPDVQWMIDWFKWEFEKSNNTAYHLCHSIQNASRHSLWAESHEDADKPHLFLSK